MSAHTENSAAGLNGEHPGFTFASRVGDIAPSVLKLQSIPGPDEAIDLASGVPDFSTPDYLKLPAIDAIAGERNQSTHPFGDLELRRNIAKIAWQELGGSAHPQSQITITSGTTAAISASLLTVVNPGDEVVIIEPFYESYLSAVKLAGGNPRVVSMRPGELGWELDAGRLAAAFNRRTRAVILNTPHNPTGKVFTEDEMHMILELCQKHGAVLISDEIYRKLVLDRHKHVSALSIFGHRDRVVVIDGLSKAFNASGWRIGYVIASDAFTSQFRKVHTTLGLAAATPLQIGAREAFIARPSSGSSGFTSQIEEGSLQYYQRCADLLYRGLLQAGFEMTGPPQGGSFIFAGASHLGAENHRQLVLDRYGILASPADAFFQPPARRRRKKSNPWLRFCFARKLATIEKAVASLTAAAA